MFQMIINETDTSSIINTTCTSGETEKKIEEKDDEEKTQFRLINSILREENKILRSRKAQKQN